MKSKNKGDKNAKTTVAKLLELPESTVLTLTSGPHIELHGNREAVVEGCQTVLEYSDKLIRLSGKGLVARFLGRDLEIGVMDHNAIIVRGFITSIEFVN